MKDIFYVLRISPSTVTSLNPSIVVGTDRFILVGQMMMMDYLPSSLSCNHIPHCLG